MVRLMGEHGEAGHTTVARSAERRSFEGYLREAGRVGISGEMDMVCFVGWLAEQQIKRKRFFFSRFPPQYLSAVHTMYGKLILPLPPSPGESRPLTGVVRSYRNWESARFPVHYVRVEVGTAQV